jgi:hypothetical protein
MIVKQRIQAALSTVQVSFEILYLLKKIFFYQKNDHDLLLKFFFYCPRQWYVWQEQQRKYPDMNATMVKR